MYIYIYRESIACTVLYVISPQNTPAKVIGCDDLGLGHASKVWFHPGGTKRVLDSERGNFKLFGLIY